MSTKFVELDLFISAKLELVCIHEQSFHELQAVLGSEHFKDETTKHEQAPHLVACFHLLAYVHWHQTSAHDYVHAGRQAFLEHHPRPASRPEENGIHHGEEQSNRPGGLASLRKSIQIPPVMQMTLAGQVGHILDQCDYLHSKLKLHTTVTNFFLSGLFVNN